MWRAGTLVESFMTPQPVTLRPSDTVADALALLERHPFRHLPVVDQDELVGIVSDRDLAFAPALADGRRSPTRRSWRATKIAEIQRRPVHTVPRSATASAAVRLLCEHRIGALPVVGSGGLDGIVTETDFLRALRGDDVSRPDAWIADPVESCMSSPVLTARPGEDLLDAAERLLGSHVRHLPVVERGELVGMLSDRDLRRGLARLSRQDALLEEQGSARTPRLCVGDLMTTDCMTIAPDRPLSAAAHTLVECRIGALPVVRGDALVGIVSQRDLLECFLRRDAQT